jgi:KaiC/GvpD/RAD55 family RecA-like ATPase
VLARYIPSLDTSPEATIKALTLELSDISRVQDVHSGYLDHDAAKRLTVVRDRVEAHAAGRPIGIPTGLPAFDDKGDTWQQGEVITIMGIPTSGKSSVLVYFCAVAYRAGRKVLFLSPENSQQDIEWRADVVLAQLDDEEWTFTLNDLRQGTVDLGQYESWLKKLEPRRDWVTVDAGEHGSFSVEDVITLTRTHRPDVLAIDGFHLLSARGKSWEVMFEAAKRIKGLTQGLGITTLCVTQATREAAVVQEDTPEMHHAAYGYAIIEDSNRVLSLAKVRGNKLRRAFKVPKFRDGEEITYRQYLDLDLNHGIIRQAQPKDAGGGHIQFD